MEYKKIYFVGIKGVGMANLAILSKEAGFDVCGCDVAEEFITDEELKKSDIKIDEGFEVEFIEKFVSQQNSETEEVVGRDKVLVIATGAHGGLGNPVCKHSEKLGIKTISYGRAVGEFMDGVIINRRDLEGVSVAGSHGKTTISAMFAFYLNCLGLDPSFIVGTSRINAFGAAGHYGRGKYFIAEADEYVSDITSDSTPKLLYQNPWFAVINNIDFDHPDFYNSIDEIEAVYQKFVAKIKKGGVLIINGDDKLCKNLSEHVDKSVKIITYGRNTVNDYFIKNFSETGIGSSFSIETPEMSFGEFKLSIPGYHNAKNVLAIVAFLIEQGIGAQKIQEIMPKFLGTRRRFEIVSDTPNHPVIIDDYAHHPEEIRATLAALKLAFLDKKIICVFQSHTYSRTSALLKEFAGSFEGADKLIVLSTFASAREELDLTGALDQKIKEAFYVIRKDVLFLKTDIDVIKYIQSIQNLSQYVLITMGAGSVYKIGEKLKASV